MRGTTLRQWPRIVIGVVLVMFFVAPFPTWGAAVETTPGKQPAKPPAGTAPAGTATQKPMEKPVEKAGAKPAAKPTEQSSMATIIDPQVDKLLKEMGEYLKSAQQYTFQADITFDDVLPSGQKIQFGATEDVALRRPNGAYFEYRGDLGVKRFWYNGETITLYDPGANWYASEKVPAKFDDAMDLLMKEFGFAPPLADLLSADPYKVLAGKVQFGIYVGMGTVEGLRCYHLAFSEKYIDWQIWIEDGKMLVPRKILITYKTIPGAPQFTAVLSDWDFVTRVPDSLFSAALPPDAEKIQFAKLATSLDKKK